MERPVSRYHRYPAEAFTASADRFEVRVGPHTFTSTGAHLDLPQLRGDLAFTDPLDPWPVTWQRPGIMGWYGLVPLLECYHGIVSFGHSIAGTLLGGDTPVSFDGGRGYLEKD